MPTPRKLPNHIPGTHRAWARRKRAEWRAVQKALRAFNQGCAYTPAYREYTEVVRQATLVAKAISPAEWTR